HEYPDDVDILLVGPNGQTCILMSDCGGDTPVFPVRLDFADGPYPLLPDSTELFDGVYRPTNYGGGDVWPAPAPPPPGGSYGSSLSVFRNADPNGTWSLYVVDDLGGDVGTIDQWILTTHRGAYSPGDYDHNGSVQPADIARFVADWFASAQAGCGL